MDYLNKIPVLKIELYKDPKDETIFYALNTSNGETFKIDGVTAVFCTLIDGSKNIEELLKSICISNQIEYSEYKDEFNSMMENLLSTGVIDIKQE